MNLKERTLQFPKTLFALVSYLVGSDLFDQKDQIHEVNKVFKINDFQKIIDFFKSKNIHVGLITSPTSIFIPWVTGNNFFNIPLEKYHNEKDAWFAAFEMAAGIIEDELPTINYRTLTIDNVIDSVNVMPASFTTLDLKRHLRSQGFFAEQKQVSDFMDHVAFELDIDYIDNGQYRTYTKPQSDSQNDTLDLSTENTTQDPVSQDSGDSKFFCTTTQKVKKFDTNKIGNWLCYNYHNRKQYKEYKATSWLQAKKQFARSQNIKYFDVRIRKA